MADDKKSSSDEYEYPADEYYKGGEYRPGETVDPLESESPPRRKSFLPKRILLLIGFLVAIGIVYFILTFRATQRNEQLQVPQETGTANIPAANVPPTITSTAVTPPSSDVDALQKLASANQDNQQAIVTMQTQMQQLQSQLNDITNSISTLTGQLQIIVNEVRATAVDHAIKGKTYTLPSGETYNLKAIVPGRAWLQSRTGHARTVTIGDQLPGYGIIQMINSEQGIVTTSSGAVIQYGPRDN